MSSQVNLVQRAWVAIRSSREDSEQFKVLQFNTLADSLSDAFPHADPAVLSWSYRKALLLRELEQHAPDLVALEEVDHVHFDQVFEPFLKTHGYRAVYKEKVNDHINGTMLAFKADRFELLAVQSFAYSAGASAAQVGVVATLQCGKRAVVFAATHLKAKPGFEQKRLEQARELLEIVGQARAEAAKASECVAVVVAGDFNEVPEQLAIVEMRKELASLYGDCHPHGHVYTTFKKRKSVVCRCIDYVFFDEATLRPLGYLDIPEPADEAFPEHLPCAQYPSDHLSIGGVFEFV